MDFMTRDVVKETFANGPTHPQILFTEAENNDESNEVTENK